MKSGNQFAKLALFLLIATASVTGCDKNKSQSGDVQAEKIIGEEIAVLTFAPGCRYEKA